MIGEWASGRPTGLILPRSGAAGSFILRTLEGKDNLGTILEVLFSD
jgi:hypothetical protein